MKNPLIYFTFFLLLGCDGLPFNPLGNFPNNSTTTVTTDECPQQSPSLSESENLEIDNINVSRSALLTANTGKAYQFEAKSGQLLNFNLDNDQICTWIFDPSGNLIDLTNSAQMPINGIYSVYLWNPLGRKTFNITMGLKNKPQPVVTSTPKPDTPNLEMQNNKTIPQSPKHDITQTEAEKIVKDWYKAKSQIFAPPYDRNLLAQYATGTTYNKNGQKDGGGSIGWLERNNCYYTYDYSNVENVVEFDNSGNRPYITVTVSEKLQLQGPQSAGCNGRSNSYRKNVTYQFEKESETWKIYDDNAV